MQSALSFRTSQQKIIIPLQKSCGYLCRLCKCNSVFLSYAYHCKGLRLLFCVIHIQFNDQIIHYWQKEGDQLTIYRPSNKNSYTIIPLKRKIKSDANSISCLFKIYIMGGFNPKSNEVLQVDLPSQNCKEKSPLPVKKMWIRSLLCPQLLNL